MGKNEPGNGLGRDPVRTPIAWDDTCGSGFTTGVPWLPIDNRPEMTVAAQFVNADSMLSLYRRLLLLRRREPALNRGEYETLQVGDHTYSYLRRQGNRCLVVSLNLSAQSRSIPQRGETLLSTIGAASGATATCLPPNEGRISVG